MTNNCGDSFCSQFTSIPGVAVWEGLPGALATLTGEVGTDLGGKVLGEDICGPNIMFGKEKYAHVRDRALLGWVGSTIAAGLLLVLGGGRFCALVWGGRIALCIAVLILGALWKGEAEMGTGAGVPTFELVPGLLLENLDMVTARVGIGLFVNCARVSWSSNAFRTVSALTSGLVLSSANGCNPVMTSTLPKSIVNLAKRLKFLSRKEYTCQ